MHLTKPEHEVLYQDLVALVGKHAGKVDGKELLAVAANMLGKLIAMQDQRKITPEMAKEIVIKNMQHGNKQIKDQLEQTKGSMN